MTPHWSIRRSAAGLWVVRRTGGSARRRSARATKDMVTGKQFTDWSRAVAWVMAQVSQWCVREALRRAQQTPGEWIALPARMIEHRDPYRKYRRIAQAAAWQRVPIRTQIAGDNILIRTSEPRRRRQ